MNITGHKTASVYGRYRIVDEPDLRDALAKTEAAVGADHAVTAVPLDGGRARPNMTALSRVARRSRTILAHSHRMLRFPRH